MTENLKKGLTPYGEVIVEFTEPNEKLRVRKFFIASIVGVVLLLASSSYIFYMRSEYGPMIITALAAPLLGAYGVRVLQTRSGSSNVTLTEDGIVFRFMPASQRFVPYEEIDSIRVEGLVKQLRPYTVAAGNGRRWRIDGWIEHDLFEHLREQLGHRWNTVHTPRPGKYPVFPRRV